MKLLCLKSNVVLNVLTFRYFYLGPGRVNMTNVIYLHLTIKNYCYTVGLRNDKNRGLVLVVGKIRGFKIMNVLFKSKGMAKMHTQI